MKLTIQILIILMLFGSIPSAIYQGKVIAYPMCKQADNLDECIELVNQINKLKGVLNEI